MGACDDRTSRARVELWIVSEHASFGAIMDPGRGDAT